ncbi:MAG TPA: dihydrolipoamide acetyltransferase family protein [Gaiellaceae bacterium]|nr:dihydrolipoamide acetyltransferase family protein [Gaiellaceae bacterium]
MSAASLVDIAMPRLSDQMEEATVTRWLKAPGDPVAKGEPLVEIETDKATMVYEAELAFVLDEIVVKEGETAALGAVIARARAQGAAAPSVARPEPRGQASAEAGRAGSLPPPGRSTTRNGAKAGRSRATPVARRLARELGVSLEGVSGTGPGGRIVRADVRRASGSAATPPPPAAGAEVPLTATQRTIAQRMAESRAQIPEFTLEAEIEMEAAATLRDDLRVLGREPLPSFNDLVVKAAALALRLHPGLNSSYAGDRIVRHEHINVGIAVATDDALYVPTIVDADRRSVLQIAEASRELIGKVDDGSISLEELRGGTFTVSNLGMFGVRRFQAVINPPQAAILAVGEVARRPVVAEEGEIVARYVMDVSLSCDHRVVYGAEAARFLQTLRSFLERPVALVAG